MPWTPSSVRLFLNPRRLCDMINAAFTVVSTILAGMRRSTGLTVKSERITGENGEMNKWVNKYLGVGEWVLDQSVAFAGTSKFFERTR
ncbi:duf1748 domain-containing protein [Xylaria longipes]|nr:duf1748 domain-containing protein [Xylaria longipes]